MSHSDELNTNTFQSRFKEIAAVKSGFCFGCDPSEDVLSAWGLPISPRGLAEFVSIVLNAAIDVVGIVKPQVAFFERFGPEGMFELKRLIAEAKRSGILVIADAKRSDIGHSVKAYANAWLGKGSGFNADAVTVTPYLGVGTLMPMFERAANSATGVFVVVRSSNPEGSIIQSAIAEGTTVADKIAAEISFQNKRLSHGDGVGPIGAVIGATLGDETSRSIEHLENSLFLVPGLGAQGATIADVKRLFGNASPRVIPSASRSVLATGPSADELRQTLKRHVDAALALQHG